MTNASTNLELAELCSAMSEIWSNKRLCCKEPFWTKTWYRQYRLQQTSFSYIIFYKIFFHPLRLTENTALQTHKNKTINYTVTKNNSIQSNVFDWHNRYRIYDQHCRYFSKSHYFCTVQTESTARA